jgi:cobalt-zinc-cadmium efflux system protein
MAHGHHHGHAHHDHAEDRRRSRRGLSVALALTFAVFLAEIAGGIAAGSLALLADAGHMLTDVAALILALVAGVMASRPAAGQRTFGWQRAEILAALANGVLLVLIAAGTIVEALVRIGDPPDVKGGLTLAVAALALGVNLCSGAVLMQSGSGLNVRAALRHVLADAVSSLGVIVAAFCILAFGWNVADPIVSIGIAVLILLSAVSILRESTDVLLEAAPAGIDVPDMGRAMAQVDGVIEVHDLHVWTVTSGFPAVAAHVTVSGESEPSLVRRRMAEMLRRHFGVTHSTLQVEREGAEQALLQIRRGSGTSEP